MTAPPVDPPPVESIDISQSVQGTYDIIVDSTNAGWVEDLKPAIEFKTKEIAPKPLLGQVMGHRLLGVGAKIECKAMQFTAATLGLAFPWGLGRIMPVKVGCDLYQYAKAVVLHPRWMGTDKSLDINFRKMVSIGPVAIASDGTADSAIPLTLVAYPDRDKLPDLDLGWIGATDPAIVVAPT